MLHPGDSAAQLARHGAIDWKLAGFREKVRQNQACHGKGGKYQPYEPFVYLAEPPLSLSPKNYDKTFLKQPILVAQHPSIFGQAIS